MDAFFNNCNPVVEETRLIPAAALLLYSLLVWRFRQPAGRQPRRWTGVEDAALAYFLFALALGLPLLYAVSAQARARAGWIALLVVGALVPVVVAVEIRGSPASAAPRRSLPSVWRNAFPAYCAVVVVLLLLVLLYLNRYLDWRQGSAMSALHDLVYRPSVAAFAQSDAERGYRGVTMGMTVLTTLVAGWTTAGLWWRNHSLSYSGSITFWVVLAAGAVGAVLTALGSVQVLAGFGGVAGNTLLCAAWRRDETPAMAVITDAFNAIGIYLPVVLALGVCLLMEPVGEPLGMLPAGPLRRRHKRSAAQTQARLDEIAERSRGLDTLIYLGAIGLVFGTLQISATYGAALSPLPTAAGLKTSADLCKAVGWPAASASASVTKWRKALDCDALAQVKSDVDVADSARRFAKQTTLTFGIAFSAILLALYLPAALLLRAEAADVVRRLDLPDSAQRNELLTRLGIESDYVGKLGRLIATLSPLVAGLLTSALSAA